MTNKEKLEKVRAEIERTMNWEKEQAAHSYGNVRLLHECREDMCKKFLSFIDYTQEKSINNGLDLGCGVIWKDVEPVSEDLEEAAQEYTEKGSKCQEELDSFKAGANWQKQQMMKNAVEVPIEEAVPFGSCKWKLCAKLWLDKGVKGNKVKLVIIKDE